MKKSLENVIKVLKLRENENTKLSVYDEDKYDIQASFNSTSVPLVTLASPVRRLFTTCTFP
jgi:hypothetical protein